MSDTKMLRVYDSRLEGSIFLVLWKQHKGNTFRLLRAIVNKDFKTRYQRSILGIWWSILNPCAMALILYFVFNSTYSQKIQSGSAFGPYILSGTLLVTYLAHGVVNITQNLQSAAGIFTKLPAPPELFALSSSFVLTLNLCAGLIPLIVWNWLSGNGPTIKILLIPLFTILTVATLTGVSLCCFYFVARFGDAINLMTLIASISIFISPVFYPIDTVSKSTAFILNLNPLTHFLAIFRYLILDYGKLDWMNVLVVISIAVFVFFGGMKFFRRHWKKTAGLL